MPSYVVTGASRGLGYAFIETLAADPSNIVIGLARNKGATERRLAADGIANAHILEADITDGAALELAAQETRRILGDKNKKGLDVLINNAGYVSSTTALRSLKDFETNLEVVVDDTQKSFEINVFGTMKAVFAFLPLIRDGDLKKAIAISSGMGDIDLINEAKLSNAAPYAASKAALSTIFAKLNASYEDEGILFMSLCPGQVNTAEDNDPSASLSEEDLKRFKAITAKFLGYAAPGFRAMEPQESARSCLAAVERSSLAGGSGGSFLSHNGTRRWM